jgi:hypothetical protein
VWYFEQPNSACCTQLSLETIQPLSLAQIMSVHTERLDLTVVMLALVFECEANFLVETIELQLAPRLWVYQPLWSGLFEGQPGQCLKSLAR